MALTACTTVAPVGVRLFHSSLPLVLVLAAGCAPDPTDTGTKSPADSDTGTVDSDTGETGETSETGETDASDVDGDGYTFAEDCDDRNASVHPGAAETCDGVDNNCSGDEDDASDRTTTYTDAGCTARAATITAW
jgi:Putative metal-binding motif